MPFQPWCPGQASIAFPRRCADIPASSLTAPGVAIFKLTRERFAQWLANVRLARLTGLFLFEFIVVLLGVLAAQAVAEWADERRLVRAAEVQFEQAKEQAINIARIQNHWATVGPCMSDRARAVARAAANGETLTAASVGRPSLPFRTMPDWDPDVRRAALKSIGPDRMDAIDFFEGRASVMAETSGKVRDAWSTFTLLDTANGSPSAVDRSNVRCVLHTAIPKSIGQPRRANGRPHCCLRMRTS